MSVITVYPLTSVDTRTSDKLCACEETSQDAETGPAAGADEGMSEEAAERLTLSAMDVSADVGDMSYDADTDIDVVNSTYILTSSPAVSTAADRRMTVGGPITSFISAANQQPVVSLAAANENQTAADGLPTSAKRRCVEPVASSPSSLPAGTILNDNHIKYHST